MEVRDRNGKPVSGICGPMILIVHFFCIEKMRSALISAVYWTINWRIVQRFVLSRHLFSCIDLLRDTHRVLRKSQRLSFSTLAPDVGRFTVYLCILGDVLYGRVWSIIIHSSPTITETFHLTPGCLTLPWSQHQWIVQTTFVLPPGPGSLSKMFQPPPSLRCHDLSKISKMQIKITEIRPGTKNLHFSLQKF